tara:strand:+ start:31689 stop:32357 length:669 start_codon:yes stop_codon:yes gene_type:complete
MSILKRKKEWIFDLDNTLYSASTKIFDLIDIRMKKYISNKFNLKPEEAYKLQKKLYYENGTTLSGLMKKFKVNPLEFLDYVHDINLSKIKKSLDLKCFIDSLPGRKIIFTNGDINWAKKMLTALGMSNSFHYIFDIIEADFIPKPNLQSYNKFIKKYKVNPKRAVFFEDTEKNLIPAYKLGMTTIHIDINHKKAKKKYKHFVDFKFSCIKSALKTISNNKLN